MAAPNSQGRTHGRSRFPDGHLVCRAACSARKRSITNASGSGVRSRLRCPNPMRLSPALSRFPFWQWRCSSLPRANILRAPATESRKQAARRPSPPFPNPASDSCSMRPRGSSLSRARLSSATTSHYASNPTEASSADMMPMPTPRLP